MVETNRFASIGPAIVDVLVQHIGLVDQHVGPASGEPLVGRPCTPGHSDRDLSMYGTGRAGSLTYSSNVRIRRRRDGGNRMTSCRRRWK